VVLTVANSLERIQTAAVEPSVLLVTSDKSLGMADFFAWAQNPREPEVGARDRRGPLVLGFAAELPPSKGAALGTPTGHGPRMVIVGSTSAIYGANWQTEQLRGTALLVESAMSWLASEPIVVDIPDKPSRAVGLTITEDVLQWAFIKLVLLLPVAALLIGVAITLRRRASEGRSRSRSDDGASA
jgi:hypothetical protein